MRTDGTEEYYKHSGICPPKGLIAGLFVGALVSAWASFFYAYADLYNPLVYFNSILCFACGLLAGAAALVGLNWGKVRNNWATLAVTGFSGFMALYFSWAIWAAAFLSRAGVDTDSFSLAWHPTTMWGVMLKINKAGAWSLSGPPVSGFELWIAWFGEAFFMIAAATLCGYLAVDAPFCERCKQWCLPEKSIGHVASGDSDEISRRLKAKDFAYLETLGRAKPGAKAWLVIELKTCPSCRIMHALTVHAVTERKDEKPKKIVIGLLIDDADAVVIRNAAGTLGASPGAS